MYITDFWRT